MRKMFVGAAVALTMASTAAHAQSFSMDNFVHESSGYVVRTRSVGGTMHLKGKHPVTGATFKLVVSPSGKVRGNWQGQPIEFAMDEAATGGMLASTAQVHGGGQ